MVSVIVPVYNVRQYLPACIESVLRQTNPDWELLLVDDGSTDGSADICDLYAEQDKRISVFHKENGGSSSARNYALEHMTGDCCIMLDSDDLIHPSLLEDAYKVLNETQADAVVYNYKKVDEGYSIAGDLCGHESIQVETLSTKEIITEILTGRRFRMLACNKLYKSDLWKDVRYPVGRKYGDDTTVTYQLMYKCGKVAYIHETYYYYRDRPGSALHTNISERNLQLFMAYSEMLNFFAERDPKYISLAAYAYDIRLFDFFSALKDAAILNSEKEALLSQLRTIVVPFSKALLTAEKLTIRQRILLTIFLLSEKCFYRIYYERDNDEK